MQLIFGIISSLANSINVIVEGNCKVQNKYLLCVKCDAILCSLQILKGGGLRWNICITMLSFHFQMSKGSEEK